MKEEKQKWWVPLLVGVSSIIFSPIIIFALIIFGFFYITKAPFERKKYIKSGYSKYYTKYYLGITNSIHYRVFEILDGRFIKYIKDDVDVNYILKKGEIINFISCDENSLYFDEKLKEWAYVSYDYLDTVSIDELNYDQLPPFKKMEEYGNKNYPNEQKNYYICTEKESKFTEEEQDGGLSGEILEMFKNDNRFIDISEILNYTD